MKVADFPLHGFVSTETGKEEAVLWEGTRQGPSAVDVQCYTLRRPLGEYVKVISKKLLLSKDGGAFIHLFAPST